MSINIKKINIIVETNIEGEAPFSLTYDKIYNPVKSRVIKSQTKLDYPYFTTDIQYNEKTLYNLAKKDYSELLRAFFDKRYFTTMVKSFDKNNEKDKTVLLETLELITNHNIFMMLYFLFPIRYPIAANISSTYNSKICKNSAVDYQVDLKNKPASNTLSSLFLGQIKDIQEENMREYSYINTSKGESTVTQIVWLNDILNEPRYRELIDSLIQYNEWSEDKKESLPKEIKASQIKYFDELKDDTNTLVFTQDDIKVIRDQKKTGYDMSKYINDIDEIISNFFVVKKNVSEQENVNTAKINLLNNINTFYKSFRKNFSTSNTTIDVLYDFIIHNLFDKCIDNTRITEPDSYKTYYKNYAKYTRPFSLYILSYYVKNGSIEIKGLDKNKLDKFNEERFSIEAEIVDEIKVILKEITIRESMDNGITDEIKSKQTEKIEEMMKKFLKQYTNITNSKNIDEKIISLDSENTFLIKILKNLINTKTKNDIEKLYGEYIKKYEITDEYFLNDKYSYTVNLLKVLNENKILDPFKEELNTKLEKYNVFAVDKATDKLVAQYKDIDIQIDKIIKLFEEYNIIIKKEYTEGDVDILFKQAMNVIDSLKPLLSDQSVERMRLTGTSSIQIKVEKNLKITNEIKVLKLVNEYLFGNQVKGINLYYDKEQTKSNIEILNELKKEKYFYFTNIVKFIKDNFVNINRETTNVELKKMMNDYFNNINDEFIEKIVIPAKNAINSKESQTENITCGHLWNTLVTKTRTSKNQKDPEFEINIYMEVIRGKVDYQTQQNIKCDYRDDNLAVLFNELTTNPNEFELMKKTSAIELPKAINNVKQIAVENKVPPIPPVALPAAQVRGGLRKRKTRKQQRRNYNFTRRRR